MRIGLLRIFQNGMPIDMTEQSLRTFASPVLPELHSG